MRTAGAPRLQRLLSTAGLVAFLAACGETGPSALLPPASIGSLTTGVLTGTAGQALNERVVVRVLDDTQRPVEGAAVRFDIVGGGGSVDPATTVTDAQGEARTRWTLGRAAGQQLLRASVGDRSVQITAIAAAGRPSEMQISAGNNQTGGAGSALPVPLSVVVRDANSNLVEGAAVIFAATGGGRVAQSAARTNAQGVASAGVWTLGPVVGVQSVVATTVDGGVTGSPATFQAIVSAGAPASIAAVSPATQSAAAGGLVSQPPSVRVTDAGGNPVPGVAVTFAVTAGGGQLTGATPLTDAQGVATVGSWRLGNTLGTNTVSASVSGATPISFTATGTAGAPVALRIEAGDGQQAPIGRAVPVAPAVRAVDLAGNPVPGVVVQFAVAAGGGVAVVSRVTTGADGIAAIGAWLLGPTPGVNTLTATAGTLQPITFTATATAGPPASMQAVSQLTQSGTAGQAAASTPSVIIRDASGNPVSGVTVTFAVASGGGSLAAETILTGTDGIATSGAWTLGATPGTNTVTATAGTLPVVTFTATTTGTPTAVTVHQGDGQAAVQGTAVPIDPAVRVIDNNGAGVPGILVTFSVLSGGGSVQGGSVVTDNQGVATVGGWTLGSGATNTLSAAVSASGVAGNPVSFSGFAATQITSTAPAPATPASGATFTFTVQLRDAGGGVVPLPGIPLTVSVFSGGGTLGGTTTLNSDSAGAAAFSLTLTGASGARQLRINGPGLTPATITVTIP